jgi:hypothetical protein
LTPIAGLEEGIQDGIIWDYTGLNGGKLIKSEIVWVLIGQWPLLMAGSSLGSSGFMEIYI